MWPFLFQIVSRRVSCGNLRRLAGAASAISRRVMVTISIDDAGHATGVDFILPQMGTRLPVEALGQPLDAAASN